MYQLLLGLYILVCFLLVVVILMQSGRGGGLVESFSAAETLFGGKTNIYMVRITIVLGALFLLIALGLNYFVVQKSKSIMERLFKNKAVATKSALPIAKPTTKPIKSSANPKQKDQSSSKKTVNNSGAEKSQIDNSNKGNNSEASKNLGQQKADSDTDKQ